ncbi:MAG: hypothetical protein LQ341_001825 [Variospora aurantia]|nr:MAG: hypothetical protein LQ341_001825 [Variospora aurantia]
MGKQRGRRLAATTPTIPLPFAFRQAETASLGLKPTPRNATGRGLSQSLGWRLSRRSVSGDAQYSPAGPMMLMLRIDVPYRSRTPIEDQTEGRPYYFAPTARHPPASACRLSQRLGPPSSRIAPVRLEAANANVHSCQNELVSVVVAEEEEDPSTEEHAGQAEKPKKENILDLTKYMDKEITVKFNGGREVVGTLKGYDQLMNLVLDDVQETLRDDAGNETTRPLGLIVARGTLLVLISPLDGSEQIENPFTQAEE